MHHRSAIPTRARVWLLIVSLLAALTACGRAVDGTPLPPPPGPLTAFSPLAPPVPAEAGYRRDVEARIATGLHVSAAVIASRLRSSAGSTVMNLAKPLGLAEDALGILVLDSLNGSADAAARSGRWTGAQAGEEKRYWAAQSPADLISEVSSWFVGM